MTFVLFIAIHPNIHIFLHLHPYNFPPQTRGGGAGRLECLDQLGIAEWLHAELGGQAIVDTARLLLVLIRSCEPSIQMDKYDKLVTL